MPTGEEVPRTETQETPFPSSCRPASPWTCQESHHPGFQTYPNLLCTMEQVFSPLWPLVF